VDLVVAASDADFQAYAFAKQRLVDARDIPVMHSFVYAEIVLINAAAEIWPTVPTKAEVHEFAEPLYPRWARMQPNAEIGRLDRVLWWAILPKDTPAPEAPIMDEVAVALGVLLTEPRRQMEALRPKLSRGIRSPKNAAYFGYKA